jgi:hypothetical protein
MRTNSRKWLISYYNTNGIRTLKEHVNTNHYFIVKKFEEELSSPLKGNVGEKSRKKKA